MQARTRQGGETPTIQTQHKHAEEQLMNNEMFAAFLKWAATQEPSKGLSRLVNKLWGLAITSGLDPSNLESDGALLKLGLAKKTGRGAGATLTYKGVK
jgi:hypothetical protein